MPKRHLLTPDGTDLNRELRAALCGWTAVDCTEDPREVTCKRCARIWTDRHFRRDRVRITMAEALLDVATVVSGPAVVSYPPLSPDGWRSMRCRMGLERCRCEWCLTDEVNANAKAEWEQSQQVRPHRRYEFDFGGVNAALELLARWRRDGPSARSSHGSVQSRAQETARLGTQVQTTRRADRDDLVTRRAIQAADVERACVYAYQEDSARRGLRTSEAISVLLSSVVEDAPSPDAWAERLGVSVPAIEGVARHGRKQVKVWLAANAYMPEPRAKDGLGPAIEKLRGGA